MKRLPFIDALKALASQLIVLHHIVMYAPMARVVAPACSTACLGSVSSTCSKPSVARMAMVLPR